DRFGGALHFAGEVFDLAQRTLHGRVALTGLTVGVLRGGRGFLGVLGDFVDGRGHLVHGGGDLIGLLALAVHAGAGLLAARGELLGSRGQLDGDAADRREQIAQLAASRGKGVRRDTELVTWPLVAVLGHVAGAGAFGDAHRIGERAGDLLD